MKILHIIFSLNVGGAETMLVDLINEQAKSETVELLVINDSINEELVRVINGKAKIYLVKRNPGSSNVFRILYFNYLVRKINPDIIHFHNHEAVRLLFPFIKAKTFLTVHTLNVPVFNFPKYKRLFAISESVRSDIFKRSLRESMKIYNGIDFSVIKPKKSYDLPGGFKIIQVGRLDHTIKGQHILIQALHQLVFQYGLLDLSVDFIGEGPSEKYLRELVLCHNLTHHVKFLGVRDRRFIYDTLESYDLLVQPSLYEGFGLSVVEGIAAGLPVIVSDIDGPAEIIRSMPFGWVFQNDHISLSKTIMLVMGLYKSGEIEYQCKMNYLTAREKFSIEETAQNYIQNYC